MHTQEVRDVGMVIERLAPALMLVDTELVYQLLRHPIRIPNHHVGTHQQFEHLTSLQLLATAQARPLGSADAFVCTLVY
ncbi:hypothetical protein D9M71_146810 [compost metagenome]